MKTMSMWAQSAMRLIQPKRSMPGSLLTALCLATSALAQDVAPNVAIPFYTSAQAAQGLYGQWYAPQSAQLAMAAAALPTAIASYCQSQPAEQAAKLAAAQQQLRTTLRDWETVSAVTLGPLVQRRSARNIDFQPLRPASLQKAIQTAPADTQALERIGAPAKGFSALEHLLVQQVAAPNSGACNYAVVAAQEIAQEAKALASEFQHLGQTPWGEDGEATTETMAEFINQWVGGLERLRWARLEKPIKSAGKKPVAWHRADQASTLNALQAQWQGLRQLAVVQERQQVPQPGVDLVPIESYLRGRGLQKLANEWTHAIEQTNQAMTDLRNLKPASVHAASAALKKLKKLMETKVAPALEINIGFSDADGD